jgi:hypothetical protein
MYQNIVIIENKPFEYEFQVEKGIIEKVNLRFDQKENPELFNLLTLLAGSKHNIYSIIETGYFSDSSPISKVLFQSIFSCS